MRRARWIRVWGGLFEDRPRSDPLSEHVCRYWWLDMVFSAQFKPYRLPSGQTIERGEVRRSVRWWATRWRAEKSSVARWFDALERSGMISRRMVGGITVTRILRYDDFQTLGQHLGQQNPHDTSDSGRSRDSDWDSDTRRRDSTAQQLSQKRPEGGTAPSMPKQHSSIAKAFTTNTNRQAGFRKAGRDIQAELREAFDRFGDGYDA